MKRFTTILTGALLSVAATATAGTVITEKPAGTERWMHGFSVSYGVSSWGFAEKSNNDGVARHLVYADNGDVYLENPLTNVATGSWIKGTLANGKLTVDTPQTVKLTTNKNGEEEAWDLRRLIQHTYTDANGKEKTEWIPDPDKSSVTFTVTDDGITMDDQNVMLGVCIGDVFYYYGDSDIVYTYVDEKAAVIPEGAEVKKWTMVSGPDAIRLGYMVDMAEVGDEVIIRGFWQGQPAATIKGKIVGNELHIPSGQYVGFLTKGSTSYYTFVINATKTRSTYLDYYTSSNDDLVFTIDRENNRFDLVDPKQNLVVKTGRSLGYEYYKFETIHQAPSFRMNTEYGRPLAPKYSESNFYAEYPDASVPFVRLTYSVEPFDEFGNAFNAKDLSYSVWVDDEKFLFDAEDAPNYKDLPAPTDEIPLEFDNRWGMSYSDYSVFHERTIQVAQMGFDKIGVQIIYTDPENGKRLLSPVAYYYPATNEFKNEEVAVGVDTITEEGAVARVIFHDLMGKRVDESYKGICIKTTVYDNGEMKNEKVLKR